jgi:hypothetical protein
LAGGNFYLAPFVARLCTTAITVSVPADLLRYKSLKLIELYVFVWGSRSRRKLARSNNHPKAVRRPGGTSGQQAREHQDLSGPNITFISQAFSMAYGDFVGFASLATG